MSSHMAEMTLTTGETVLLDDEDLRRLGRLSWRAAYIDGTVYVRSTSSKGHLYLHHAIMAPPPGMYVHFKNANRLDFRRESLMVSPYKGRGPHRRRWAKGGKFAGVKQAKSGKWEALGSLHGNAKRIGTFATEIEAATAYDEWMATLFGDAYRINSKLIEASRREDL